MAAAGKGAVKEPQNVVHQNAILCETIRKEQRHQKIYTSYSVNPYKKIHVITGKPNSKHDTEEGEEDSHFLSVINRASLEPVKKYSFPQTESQEYGWISKSLIERDTTDKRLSFHKCNTAITKYNDKAWGEKEQRENMN
ncbi:cilia- and flagella-associated protein 144-like [Haliotis asinina]|uniref:cilia- and flagella-associated protein 144-like n=1 Tax=Haliotis asinina TaxID=109174 RepID=UPI0035323CBF